MSEKRIPRIDNSNQQQRQEQETSLNFQCNSFISGSSLQLHSRHYTGARQTSLFGFGPWLPACQKQHNNYVGRGPCRMPTMSATATIDDPLLTSTTLTRPLSRSNSPWRPSLQVQPEHHINYNRNANQNGNWQWQCQLWNIDQWIGVIQATTCE